MILLSSSFLLLVIISFVSIVRGLRYPSILLLLQYHGKQYSRIGSSNYLRRFDYASSLYARAQRNEEFSSLMPQDQSGKNNSISIFNTISSKKRRSPKIEDANISKASLIENLFGNHSVMIEKNQSSHQISLYFHDNNGFISHLSKLGEAKITWNSLTLDDQERLLEFLRINQATFSDEEAIRVLRSLAKLDMTGYDIGRYLIQSIISKITSSTAYYHDNPTKIVEFFNVLYQLSITWSILSSTQRIELSRVLQHLCDHVYTAHDELALALRAFSRIADVPFNQSMKTVSARYQVVLNTSIVNYIPESTQQALFSCVADILPQSSPYTFPTIVRGLSHFKFQWQALPRSTRERILAHYTHLQNSLPAASVATLLLSLSDLQCLLDRTNTQIQDAVFRSVLRVLDTDLIISDSKSKNSNSYRHSTSNVDEDGEYVGRGVRAVDIGRIVKGLSGCGISWNMLPVSLRWKLNGILRQHGQSFSLSDIATIAYAMTLMSFDVEDPSDISFRGIHERLVDLLQRHPDLALPSSAAATTAVSSSAAISPKFNKNVLEQLRIFALYAVTMQYVRDVTQRIPPLLQTTDTISFEEATTYESSVEAKQEFRRETSRLQDRVLDELETLLMNTAAVESSLKSIKEKEKSKKQYPDGKGIFYVKREFSPFAFGTFPIDAVIYFIPDSIYRQNVVNLKDCLLDEYIIGIIEVDGPFHYQYDGRLRRKDRLKSFLYQRYFPDAILQRIRYDDVQRLGPKVIAQETKQALIQVISQQQRDFFGLNRQVRKFQRSWDAFFGWGLRNTKTLDETMNGEDIEF